MKLFVAKLPQSVTSERLRAMFEAYGEVVDAKIIMDRETGKSKCYGFVEMNLEDAGRSAIENMNGAQLEGREILVKESDPAPPRSDNPRGPRPGGGGGGGYRPSYNSGGGDRRQGGNNRNDRGDRWNNDRKPASDRQQDYDRPRRRYDDDDYDDKPRRKRI